ncbi:PilZ domain-containing protein [Paenibacillus sp. NEAU-GSW1]|uniref:PilZ domain-containing protein n=1 Tax=Paenibacillus sp. NEAU-GSW1 TaxID=2682486 RepID=UPI0015645B23|nr:PilZ domain-containing protein [Paenibacillus sp. NEAU-GSW1]
METNRDELRSHIRMRLTQGIKAELRLLDDQGLLLTRNKATVLLLNISQEGLRFLSGLKLPVQSSYLVEFKLALGEVSLELRGHVVWREQRDNQYEYGIAFNPPNRMKPILIKLLNQEMLRQSPNQHKIHQLYRKLRSR